ncbi:V-type ATP synthase subunit I [Synergistales bacterium]|nr:V-type ATP synthase subunit I [Synergistales bacterium]
MAIVKMRKARMVIHKSVADEFIDGVQKLGCCQFIPDGHGEADDKALASLRAKLRKLDDLLSEVRFAMRFLDSFADKKLGGAAMSFGDAPKYSMAELASMISEQKAAEKVEVVRQLEKKLSDAKSSSSKASGLVAQLLPLKPLPYSLDFYSKGTETVRGALFSVSGENAKNLKASLASLGDLTEFFELPPQSEKDDVRIVSVIYSKEAEEKFQSAIGGLQLTRVDVPPQLPRTAAEELGSLQKELTEAKELESNVTTEIGSIANPVYEYCQICADYWNLEKMRVESLISGDQTETMTLLSFWLPAKSVDRFKQLADKYSSLMEIDISDPKDGETPPSLLYNNSFSVPIETLTEMYGTPTYGGFDPTAVMAPFFYAFFGICFGDAGYGLLVAGILIAIMMKKHVTGTLRNFLQILIIGNLCAVAFGAVTFSWFGDSIAAFGFLSPLLPLGKLQILDPMGDPMTMLGVSLALGFLQIMVGLLIALKENVRQGNLLAAFADQGGWIIFLCGLVAFGLASSEMVPLPVNVCGGAAILGALILVFTQGREKESIIGKAFSGILSLYNVTSYLGDLLSYSRLLALGLGSAAIGMVINMLANLVSESLPGVGAVIGIVIFVCGHLFSIAVNLLGAFVHSLRLQYVEFFSKFLEASGEEFTPLARSTQFVKVTD